MTLRLLPVVPEPVTSTRESKEAVLQMAEQQVRHTRALRDRLRQELGIPESRAVAQNVVRVLQSLGSVPRVHGNGFVQLDLTPTMRLHIWGDQRIPQQATPSPIHNHRFGFVSYVLVGALRNMVYRPVPLMLGESGAVIFDEYTPEPRDGEDTVLRATGNGYVLDTDSDVLVRAGESYTLGPGKIHDSQPEGLTVTVIVKTVIVPQLPPSVFLPVGAVPDNTFNRNTAAPPELLWQIIEDAVHAAG